MEIFKKKRRRRFKKSIWESSFTGWGGITGVYCICTGGINQNTLIDEELKVWYVGSSKNIGNRLNNRKHPYYVL